jgi:hypothetical protein
MVWFRSAPFTGEAFRDANVYLVLLAALVLIYIGDMSRSRMVTAIVAAALSFYYPFHEFYILTTYGEGVCDIMAGIVILPIVLAYTIFRAAEKQADKHPVSAGIERYLGSRYVWLTVALGLFMVFLACSVDALSLEQFVFYDGGIQ